MACNQLSVLRYSGTIVGYISDVLLDLKNEHPLLILYMSGVAMVMSRRFYELETKEDQDEKSQY